MRESLEKKENMRLRVHWLYLIVFVFMGMSVISCDKEEEPEDEVVSNDCKDFKNGDVFDTIPNLGFDFWVTSKSKRYEDPIPTCFWTTGNAAADITILGLKPPTTVFKVGNDSARTGFAAMLKTFKFRVSSNKDVTAGGLATGNFKPNITNPGESLVFGKPFTKKVKKVSGYYRYFPGQSDEGIDSAGIYALMMMDQETVAIDRLIVNDTVSDWTLFELNLDYNPSESTNKLSISFGSSEAGPDLRGEVGSTLFVDDLEVEYYP